MLYVAYCSSATRLMSSEELVALLQTSRVNNERAGITGMLLYRDGSFLQIIEGEDEAVHATYARILVDPRHRNVIRLAQSPITERSFAGWTMGFCDLAALSGDDLDAFSTFLIEPFDAEQYATEGKALKLLRTFRRIAA